jgi:hypothetical protein
MRRPWPTGRVGGGGNLAVKTNKTFAHELDNQEVTSRRLTPEAWVPSQGNPCRIFGRQNGTVTLFFIEYQLLHWLRAEL